MKQKVENFSKRMERRQPQPPTPGLNRGPNLSASEVITVVRRIGYVALAAYETIQGNLISRGNYQLAEVLGDTLKPLVDMLVHFELPEEEVTEVDREVP